MVSDNEQLKTWRGGQVLLCVSSGRDGAAMGLSFGMCSLLIGMRWNGLGVL